MTLARRSVRGAPARRSRRGLPAPAAPIRPDGPRTSQGAPAPQVQPARASQISGRSKTAVHSTGSSGSRKQLSSVSSANGRRGLPPRGAGADHGIKDEEEFVHAGGQGDLLGLAGAQQPRV